MRHDLSGEQWRSVDEGRLTGPDGVIYSRRSTRTKRRDAAALVASGCPVVTYWPGGLPAKTELVWHDAEDARVAWTDAAGLVSSEGPRPPRRGPVVTAGRWESPDGEVLLVLSWHH
ncbi:hypothetical protein SAMN06893096_102358 [Geodermatophilus pulveris]|uniref:Uncharacterized protein n=1 Tax=Geodermatophilus pulveris TaxID=1564159 RepID=A0A239CD66_9ACTN|nr:hypothetical protein [Geodermatophilus pulveris]SNS17608.1 hypothetical protein SAMN06893096_102358 [Geodermatophilus pulveris]